MFQDLFNNKAADYEKNKFGNKNFLQKMKKKLNNF